MKGKRVIFSVVLILAIFLCASAVSAASTNTAGTMVNAPKKVNDTTSSQAVASAVPVPKKVNDTNSRKTVGYSNTYVIYFQKYGKTYWYRCTVHYINYKNVYTNYVNSWGGSGYMQFRKGSVSPRWYQTTYGNFWVYRWTRTIAITSSHNNWSATNWLNWFNTFNKYTLKKQLRGY